MLNSYLASLELRIQGLEKLLGDSKEYRESEVKEVREGISDVLAKVHKDVSRKCKGVCRQLNESKKSSRSIPLWWTRCPPSTKSPWFTLNWRTCTRLLTSSIAFKSISLLWKTKTTFGPKRTTRGSTFSTTAPTSRPKMERLSSSTRRLECQSPCQAYEPSTAPTWGN